jgi:hypothetical protein
MSKKLIFVLLCLLGFEGFAFASNWGFDNGTNWISADANGEWFDPCNWSAGTEYPPDWRNWVCIEHKNPGPVIDMASPHYGDTNATCFNPGGGASCAMLFIHPWQIYSGTGEVPITVTLESGDFNCGRLINLCHMLPFDSAAFGYAQLDVNGGVIYTGGIPNIPDWNYPCDFNEDFPWMGGVGIEIGGGWINNAGLNYGVVNIRNDGQMFVQRVMLYNGTINVLGGLLYVSDPCNDYFYISQAWARNRINVAGGELRLNGDRQEQVNYYIGKGRMTAYDNHGMFIIDFNGTDTSVTAVGDYNAAWSPNPIHLKQNVPLTPTLTWQPGAMANNENLGSSPIADAVYLGTDADAVANATTASPLFKGYKNYNDPNSYTVTPALAADTDYFWRIDEYNDLDPCSPWTGYVWRFKTVGGSAVEPIPPSGTVGLPVPLQLDWLQGAYATTHHLFFGTDAAAVADATTDNTLGVYIGTVSRPYTLGNLPFDLERDTDYYWRIDEADNGAGYWKGEEAWMFRNTNYFVVEDFNSYETSEDMNARWVTGYDLQPECYVTAQAGLQWSGVGGRLSFYYANTATPYFSEARFITNSGSGSDWTGGGALPSADPIVAVAIGYQGNGTNTADPDYDGMYMGIEDSDGSVDMVLNPDANATRDVFGWSEWKVTLSDLGVPSPMNQASIKYFYVGVGVRCGGNPGGIGTVLFDDVRLYQKSCNPDGNGIVGDFTRDCVVNYSDLDMLVADWLATGSTINLAMTTPVNNYIARYNFDASGGTTVADVCGNYNASVVFDEGGTVDDSKIWKTTGGYDGSGCFNLPNDELVDINLPPSLLDAGNTAGVFTIMCWIKFDYFAPTGTWPRLFAAREPNDTGTLRDSLEIECPGPRPPSADDGPRVFFNWTPTNAAGTGTDNNSVSTAANQMVTANFANQWNHYAFVFNSSTDKMRIYHNGYQVADGNATTHMMTHPASTFSIGNRVPGSIGEEHWYGSVDDVRFFTREVSAGEIAYIGSRNTGVYQLLLDSVANINTTGTPQKVNFGDFAYMAQHWLEQTQWP